MITDVIGLNSMKSVTLCITAFASSMCLALFFLRPAHQPHKVPFNSTPLPLESKTCEIQRTTSVSVYKHSVASIKSWESEFGDANEETCCWWGNASGKGTLVSISFEEHHVGSFDGNNSTHLHFQLPENVSVGRIYEFSPIKTSDAESQLSVGKMNVFRWVNPFYARSVTLDELTETAKIKILNISSDSIRFRLTIGAVDWLDELPVEDVFDGAIAR